jgi:hypothetical protein
MSVTFTPVCTAGLDAEQPPDPSNRQLTIWGGDREALPKRRASELEPWS